MLELPLAPRRALRHVVLVLIALVAATATAHAAAPAWTVTPPLATGPAKLLDVSCPTSRLCVAVDAAGGALSTTRPASTVGRWQSTPLSTTGAFDDVSCTATGFCAAVGLGSSVATSSRPTGAAAAWTVTDLKLRSEGESGPQPDELLHVGCASAQLCVAATFSNADNLIVSGNPGASAPVWKTRSVGSVRGGELFQAVSCPARSLCVAAGSFGKVATSTDAGRHWRFAFLLTPRDRNGSLTPRIEDVSCPTTTFCAAVDGAAYVITTSRPAGGARAWHRTRLGRRHALRAISCASASLCAGVDRRGRVLASTRPAGPASSWKPVAVGQPVARVSCASTRLCLLLTRSGRLVAARRR
jgi:hypothetical protein